MEPTQSATSLPIETIVANHEKFLDFLERRVDSRDTARDILQRAYLTGLEKERMLRDPRRVVPWFYRLLRNAVIDHYRHLGAEKRALERFGFEKAGEGRIEAELERQICDCVSDLIPKLRSDWAELIREVDLDGEEIAAVAARRQITPNNARVRLFRARRTLRKALLETCGVCAEHSCLDCSCGSGHRPAVS